MFKFLFAIFALGTGLYTLYSNNNFNEIAAKSKGTVIDYHIESDKTKPIIEYKVNRRQKMRLELNILLFSPEFEKGQKVNVLYDPKNPTNARVRHFFNSWKFSFLLIFLGMIFMPGSRSNDDQNHVDLD